MTGFEALPVLEQVLMSVMVIGAIFIAFAAVLLVASYTIIGLLFAFDTLLDWLMGDVEQDAIVEHAVPERRWNFRHAEPEVHLPYAEQISALEQGVLA